MPARRTAASRRREGLDVEQDGTGLAVRGQVVEQVAEIHVHVLTQRDEMGEAQVLAVRPVQQGGEQRAGLGHRGEVTRCGGSLGEAGIEPEAGLSTPMQFGPSSLGVWGRAASSAACFCWGVRPAVTTATARVPCSARSATRGAMMAGGVHSTARSGTKGRSRAWP